MKFENLAILLTCHSLEDFPVHYDGDEADSLLSNWTALWHPQLIADAGKIPTWVRTYEVPENCKQFLFLCPISSDSELQTGFAQRVKEEDGQLIRRKTDREDILASVFADEPSEIENEELIRDFFALGYCYLQIQLLTRQLRYSSNLDEVYFSTLVVGAAQAAKSGDEEAAQQKLQAAFDLLMEERDNYYPVNALLIDLTLVAETTIGKTFQQQLGDPSIHRNYLVSGEVASQIGNDEELCATFKGALEKGQATIVGGSQSESRFPMLSLESLVDEFRQGQETYQKTFSTQVDFFGRRRYGLAVSLPQILEHFKFRGAFHFTLDDGRFPEGMQIKSFWEGDGDARIEVFGKVPLDATASGNFLNLGVKIGESFDMDHAAAICFVHWPGQSSVWYEDLQRISKFGCVLGKFVSATQFLEDMDEPYQHDRFNADQYQSPYLKQAVIRNQPDPISRSVRYWKRSLMLDSVQTLNFLSRLFSAQEATPLDVARYDLVREFESDEALRSDFDEKLLAAEQTAASRFAESLPGEESADAVDWIINPTSLVQRCSIEIDGGSTPAIEKPVYSASELESNRHQVVVDVPSMGYAAVHSNQASHSPSRKKPQLLVDEFLLRNDFMEVVLDQSTGGIRAIHDYKSRGNRMSQILAWRGRSPSDSNRYVYSKMKFESIEVLHNSISFGRIKTTGKLWLEDQAVAEYEQVYSLYRGSRVVRVDVSWSNLEPPKSDPWNCYFASRFAFGDESSLISTTLNQTRQPVSGNRIEAPQYIDLENLQSRTSLLTGGVPFHIRRGDRYIDSIQIVKGESERCFTFGIGVDLPNPIFHAHALIKPPVTVRNQRCPKPDYSWLFHLDSRNILATSWNAIAEQGKTASGCRVRLLETMGRETKCKLSAFRAIQSAQQIRFDGEAVADLTVRDGKVELNLSPNQMLEVEVRW